MERVAVYAGSFDPITMGHMDLVRRATGLFDRVILSIGHNPKKHSLLPIETRRAVLEECTEQHESQKGERAAKKDVKSVECPAIRFRLGRGDAKSYFPGGRGRLWGSGSGGAALASLQCTFPITF